MRVWRKRHHSAKGESRYAPDPKYAKQKKPRKKVRPKDAATIGQSLHTEDQFTLVLGKDGDGTNNIILGLTTVFSGSEVASEASTVSSLTSSSGTATYRTDKYGKRSPRTTGLLNSNSITDGLCSKGSTNKPSRQRETRSEASFVDFLCCRPSEDSYDERYREYDTTRTARTVDSRPVSEVSLMDQVEDEIDTQEGTTVMNDSTAPQTGRRKRLLSFLRRKKKGKLVDKYAM